MKPEWAALLRDLDRLQEIETEQEGKHFILRTPVAGAVGRVFQAVGIALPPNIREAEAAVPIDGGRLRNVVLTTLRARVTIRCQKDSY